MLSIQFDNYLQLKTKNFFNENAEIEGLLSKYDPSLLSSMGFIEMLDRPIEHIQTTVQNFEKYSTILLVGLGGSSLGPKMLVEALPINTNDTQLHFVDTVDPCTLQSLMESISLVDTLVIVVSKSGNTPETVGLYHYFLQVFRDAGLGIQPHLLVITDKEKGYLREQVNANNFTSLCIPTQVGGRFSVLSEVGLVVAELAGLNCTALLNGAKHMHTNFSTPDALNNKAFKFALLLHHEYCLGKNILVLFTYADRLKSFGDWCVQLLAESLGKTNTQGEAVGLTPHSARGVSDQHSQLQLFADGPDDKVYLMIKPSKQSVLYIPTITDERFGYLSRVDFGQLLTAEFEATTQSLHELNRPIITMLIEEINEFNIGELVVFMEAVTIYLSTLLDVNPLDQPGVERSKLVTKEILSNRHH